MVESQVYALNPNYFMRMDGTVATLCDRPQREEERHPHKSGFVSHLHPLTAHMLAFFDGNRTFGDVVRCVAERFSLPKDKVSDLLSRYVENAKSFEIPVGTHAQYIPVHCIVEIQEGVCYKKYDPALFIATTKDFDSPVRLSKPLTGMFLPTMRCVTDCEYCYADRRRVKNAGFSSERILELIDEAADLQMEGLDISGGDFFLYLQWEKVLTRLVEKGFSPRVSTKKPLSVDEVERLVATGVDSIQFSIDTLNPIVASSLLRVDGESYVREVLATLDLLSRAGIKLFVNTVITPRNSDLEVVKSHLETLLAYKNLKRIMLSPAGYSLYRNKTAESYLPTAKSIELIREYVATTFGGLYSGVDIRVSEGSSCPSADASRRKEDFDSRAFCTGNLHSFVVLPDGRVTICEELYYHPAFIIGNLAKQSIEEMWQSQEALSLFNRPQSLFPEDSACSKCADFLQCRRQKGVCWKFVIMAYGQNNWQYPDPTCPLAPTPIRKYWNS